MNSKVVLIIVGLLIAGGVIGAIILMSPKETKEVVVSVPTSTPVTPTPFAPMEELTTYQNESGFEFQHPKDITVTEGKLDKTSYANLTLTSTLSSRNIEGDIRIKVADTKLKDNAALLKDNKEATKGAVMKTVKFADLEALEFTRPSSISAVAVGQQVLYTFDIDLGNEPAYWEKVYRTILNTFAFALPEEASVPASSGSSSGGSPDIIFEGEEIIE
ncbi:hypothetical protein HY468_02090 [Candidatus Roizmanbacteria bacterium]|nr:hypothetical protein [Candidatus Roizmanbacteria bacterium]